MSDEWVEKWKQVKDPDTSLKILTELANPNYAGVTTSSFAVNTLGMGGPLHSTYTSARDQLEDLGFITYSWGEPVLLSPGFKEFIVANGPRWTDVLTGRIAPPPKPPVAPPTPPIPSPQPPKFPAMEEDESFWERIDSQVKPLLESEVSHHGDVLYVATARQGGRVTGGRFSRPDLTYVIVGRYPLSGERYLDIISVEGKVWEKADDMAHAYEAIAYKRFSTRVYYAYESPSETGRISREVEEVLKENGVGIIRIWREGKEDKIRIDAEPVRSVPPPGRIESQLEILKQVDERGITKLLHVKYR